MFSENHSEPRVENRLEWSTAGGWEKDYEFAEIFLGEVVAARKREVVRTERIDGFQSHFRERVSETQ